MTVMAVVLMTVMAVVLMTVTAVVCDVQAPTGHWVMFW